MDGFIPRNSKRHRKHLAIASQPAEPREEIGHQNTQASGWGYAKEPVARASSELTDHPEPEKLLPAHTKKHAAWLRSHKKIAIPLLLVLLTIIGAAAYVLILKPDPVVTTNQEILAPSATPTPQPTSSTVASPLTGLQVSPELAARPVMAVMIENSTDARPQSGLNKAGVIFEAIAEGGITRFVTLFQEGQPDYLGPVRSVRPYYVDWAAGFDAPIVHVGGSVDGKAKAAAYGKDLDQFSYGSYFQRISERFAPHNVYTSSSKLDELLKKTGYTSSTFVGWERKAAAPLTAPKATTLDIGISGFAYNPHYAYLATCNCYKRSMADEPHLDEKSKEQLAPTVVIAMSIGSKTVNSSDGSRYSYDTIGSGTATVFQDGDVIEAKWSKKSMKENVVFTDANGANLKLNAGQVWISMVSALSKVTYQ